MQLQLCLLCTCSLGKHCYSRTGRSCELAAHRLCVRAQIECWRRGGSGLLRPDNSPGAQGHGHPGARTAAARGANLQDAQQNKEKSLTAGCNNNLQSCVLNSCSSSCLLGLALQHHLDALQRRRYRCEKQLTSMNQIVRSTYVKAPGAGCSHLSRHWSVKSSVWQAGGRRARRCRLLKLLEIRGDYQRYMKGYTCRLPSLCRPIYNHTYSSLGALV